MENIPQRKLREDITNEVGTEESAESIEKCSSQSLTYDVLRTIFQYLNGMELSNASMVCRSWLEAANNEKQIRGPVCSKEFINEMQNVEYIKSQIIEQLWIKPALGLFFTGPSFPSIKRDCHCKVLPKNCTTVTLRTYGIVINNNEIEDNLNYLASVFLPEIPNVSIKTVTISDSSMKMDGIKKCTEDIKKALDTPEKNHNKSKCLLLFCDLRGRKLAIRIADSLKKCYTDHKFSVWGGVARDLLICNGKGSKNDECEKFPVCVGITLTGSIDTWSIVVDRSCNTKDRVERRLKLLKSRVCLKKHSIGFMFACCARGENMFNERNLESSVFKTLFPEVSLIGCFGDGEFGETSISSEPTAKRPRWYNETTTIFLIISYS
ncbi:F-box only protein 22-like isoform X2 [Calliopsis andreniformis]|uniref:F-box only protein 22-like isoform X2 n=1 Tax=Calliopsis andreniformis TaxID=337506 RepID=UPI003FCE8914